MTSADKPITIRLIQRLLSPPSKDKEEHVNPFQRQGPQINQGFTAESYARLREIFIFDPMGAGEFETDRQRRSLEYLYGARDHLVSFRRVIAVRKAPFGLTSPTELTPFYFVAPKALAATVERFARYEAGYDNMNWRDVRLERGTLLSQSVFDPFRTRVEGWLALDEGQPFFFAKDKKMANGFADILQLAPSWNRVVAQRPLGLAKAVPRTNVGLR